MCIAHIASITYRIAKIYHSSNTEYRGGTGIGGGGHVCEGWVRGLRAEVGAIVGQFLAHGRKEGVEYMAFCISLGGGDVGDAIRKVLACDFVIDLELVLGKSADACGGGAFRSIDFIDDTCVDYRGSRRTGKIAASHEADAWNARIVAYQSKIITVAEVGNALTAGL